MAVESDKALRKAEDYGEHFDVESYLQSRFVVPKGVEDSSKSQPLSFQLSAFHEFYTQYNSHWDASTARLLEVGGGPVIWQLIPACPYVKEIVFTDYLEKCLKQVRLWRDKDPSAHNWGPFFEYVVGNLEGETGKDTAVQREEDLRSKVTVERCDLNQDDVVDPKLGTFDIISTSYCLACIAGNKKELEDYHVKLARRTTVGGYLLNITSIESSWYRLDNEEFKHVWVTCDDVKAMMEKAGYVVEMVKWCPLKRDTYTPKNDATGRAVFVGRRVK